MKGSLIKANKLHKIVLYSISLYNDMCISKIYTRWSLGQYYSRLSSLSKEIGYIKNILKALISDKQLSKNVTLSAITEIIITT